MQGGGEHPYPAKRELNRHLGEGSEGCAWASLTDPLQPLGDPTSRAGPQHELPKREEEGASPVWPGPPHPPLGRWGASSVPKGRVICL